MSKALLYDATMCIDCKQCEQGCASENHLPYNDTIAAEQKQSEHKFTAVLNQGDKYMRRLCMNCQDPACVSACPVAALRKTAAGPVTYDEGRCMGCRYCMMACPFNVPKYEWGKVLPFPLRFLVQLVFFIPRSTTKRPGGLATSFATKPTLPAACGSQLLQDPRRLDGVRNSAQVFYNERGQGVIVRGTGEAGQG